MSLALVNVATVAVEDGTSSNTLVSGSLNHTAGNLIHIGSRNSTSDVATILSITDTANNEYFKITSITTYANDNHEVWIARNINGNASNVITINFSGSVPYRSATISQYSGLTISLPSDAVA